jgi:hypothetical protein
MKKVFLLALLMATMMNANAQQHNLWELWTTPKAGVAVSNFSTHGGDFKIGFTGGANAEVFFNNHVSLIFDISYSRQGSVNVYHTLNNERTGPYDYSFDMLNTEYLGRYYLGSHFALTGGLHLGRIMKARSTFNGKTNAIKDQLHRGLVSIPAGFAINFGNIDLEAKYNFSLNKVPKTAKAKAILGQCHEHLVQVTLGYRINVLW